MDPSLNPVAPVVQQSSQLAQEKTDKQKQESQQKTDKQKQDKGQSQKANVLQKSEEGLQQEGLESRRYSGDSIPVKPSATGQKVFQKYPGQSFEAVDERSVSIPVLTGYHMHLQVLLQVFSMAIPYTLVMILSTAFVPAGYPKCNLGQDNCELEWALSTMSSGVTVQMAAIVAMGNPEKFMRSFVSVWTFFRFNMTWVVQQFVLQYATGNRADLQVLYMMFGRGLPLTFPLPEIARYFLDYDDWWHFSKQMNDPVYENNESVNKMENSQTSIGKKSDVVKAIPGNAVPPASVVASSNVMQTSATASSTTVPTAVVASSIAMPTGLPPTASKDVADSTRASKNVATAENSVSTENNDAQKDRSQKRLPLMSCFLNLMILMCIMPVGSAALDVGWVARGEFGETWQLLRPVIFFIIKRAFYLLFSLMINKLTELASPSNKPEREIENAGYLRQYSPWWQYMCFALGTGLAVCNSTDWRSWGMFVAADFFAFGLRVFAFSKWGEGNEWVDWYRASLLLGKPVAVGKMDPQELHGWDMILQGITVQVVYTAYLLVYGSYWLVHGSFIVYTAYLLVYGSYLLVHGSFIVYTAYLLVYGPFI